MGFGPWIPGLPIAPVVPTPEPAALLECSDDEATRAMLATEHGKYWAESWQGKLKRMRDAGYVLAKRPS